MNQPQLNTVKDLAHILAVNWKIEEHGSRTFLTRKDLYNWAIVLDWQQQAIVFADRYSKNLETKIRRSTCTFDGKSLLTIESEAIRHIQKPMRGHPGLNGLFRGMDQLRKDKSAPGSVYALSYKTHAEKWEHSYALIELNPVLQRYFATAVGSYQSAQRMDDMFGLQRAKNKISLVVKPTGTYQQINLIGEYRKGHGFCWLTNNDGNEDIEKRPFECIQGCNFQITENWQPNSLPSYIAAAERAWESHKVSNPKCYALIDF